MGPARPCIYGMRRLVRNRCVKMRINNVRSEVTIDYINQQVDDYHKLQTGEREKIKTSDDITCGKSDKLIIRIPCILYMAQKKNQHYVPQFLLKKFSAGNSSISKYLIQDNRIISTCSIKRECSKDYFYSDVKIEEKLSDIESSNAITIKKIEEGGLSTISQVERKHLYAFILLQDMRTKQAADDTSQVFEDLKSFLLQKGVTKDIEEALNKVDTSVKHSVMINLLTFTDIAESIYDLKCKLLVNKTKTVFITSDHPVVKYDQFYERIKAPYYSLSSIGIEYILPISPNTAILLYDGNVYKIGHRKELTIEINNNEDIDKINLLTAMYADTSIYFKRESITLDYLSDLISKANEYKTRNKYELQEVFSDDRSHELLIGHNISHFCNAKLSFIKELDKMRYFSMESKYGSHELNPMRKWCRGLSDKCHNNGM